MAALEGTTDEKLTGLALRIALSDYIGIPRENDPDMLTGAEELFVPKKPKATRSKAPVPGKKNSPAAKKVLSGKKAA